MRVLSVCIVVLFSSFAFANPGTDWDSWVSVKDNLPDQYFVVNSLDEQKVSLVLCKPKISNSELNHKCDEVAAMSEIGYQNLLHTMEQNSNWYSLINQSATMASVSISLVAIGTNLYTFCPAMVAATGESVGTLGGMGAGGIGIVAGALTGAALGAFGCLGISLFAGLGTGYVTYHSVAWIGSLYFDAGYENMPEGMEAGSYQLKGQMVYIPNPGSNENSKYFIDSFKKAAGH